MLRRVALLALLALCLVTLASANAGYEMTADGEAQVSNALSATNGWGDEAPGLLGCTCKSKTVAVGTCSDVKAKVCGCIKSFKLKYKADASTNGKTGSYQYTKSPTGAANHAVLNLFNQLSFPGACNCVTGTQAVGRCNLPYRACFYFENENQIDNKQSSWKAFVDGSAVEGTSTAQATPQAAVAAAIVSFAKANPAYMAQCQAAVAAPTEADFSEASQFGSKVNAALHEQKMIL